MKLFALLVTSIAFCAASTSSRAQTPMDAASKPSLVRDSMAQRMQACVVCHGKEGRATNTGYFPRIAGKPAGYLFNQLQNFREGRRHNAVMHHLMQHMSDGYLMEIAEYFSSLDLPYPPDQSVVMTPDQRSMAETLVFKGAPDRRIPACIACHGSKMAGQLPAMPGLLTLPPDYLIAQLGAWRTGQRKAKAPDCMADVAKRLTAEEVSVTARWLSAQTLPTGTKPEAASDQPLPIPCGSSVK